MSDEELIKKTFDMVLHIYQSLPGIHGKLERHDAELKFAHGRIQDLESTVEKQTDKIDKAETTGSHDIIIDLRKSNDRWVGAAWKIGIAVVTFLLGAGIVELLHTAR